MSTSSIYLKGIERARKDPAFWACSSLPEAPGANADLKKKLTLKNWQLKACDLIRDNTKRLAIRVRRQSGKTIVLCVIALWYAMWTRSEIMIVCPRENMILNFYEKLQHFLQNTPILDQLVVRESKQPFRVMEFKTGAKIKFMIAGLTGSGVRGQSADVLILDECDMLTEAAYKAIMPVINDPEKIVIAGTTINGTRSYFYYWIHDEESGWTDLWVNPEEDPDFLTLKQAEELGVPVNKGRKEYYKKVEELGLEDKSHEYYYRKEMKLTDLAYMHEVECIWADAAHGVYRRKDIERALEWAEWTYDEYLQEQKPTVGPTFIGVDWDKWQGAGPQICAVQFDTTPDSPTRGKLRVIYREEIPPGEYCLGEGVERIIRLNQLLNPEKIYIDPGLGERQIEELRLYGANNPESGLKEKVVRFHFKAKDIEFVDTITGEVYKKENKHWMVGTSAYYFQEGRIALTPEDELLADNLRDYTASVTKGGTLTYTDENEHTVDAMNLAIAGFERELGENYSAIYEGTIFVEIGKLRSTGLGEESTLDSDVGVVSESSVFRSIRRDEWDSLGNHSMGGYPLRRGLSGVRTRRSLI